MKLNPTEISWKAPTTNIDGTAIDYELIYELGIQDANGGYKPYMVIPGQLRADERYVAPIEDLDLPDGNYTVALRSFEKDNPSRVSQWSNGVSFEISGRIPTAPLDLRVS